MRLAWIRVRKRPLIAVAVLLFIAIIAMALCSLYRGKDNAHEHYNDICNTIEVRCTVTNLAGDQSDHLSISADMISLFTGDAERLPDDLAEMVENVQITGSTDFVWYGDEYTLTGITSMQADSELWTENGCTVFWNAEGNESIFAGNDMVCIIPQELANKLQEWEMPGEILSLEISAGYGYETDYSGEVKIVGTYQGKSAATIYCPWDAYVMILRSMGRLETAESLSAVLCDNQNVEALRKISANWFAEPDPNAAGMAESNGYYLALDINDSQLVQAKTNLNNSMAVNRIAVVLVFVMSTGAGALVGFLMIRSRKREIIIMRSVGTSNHQIYGSFVFEQMVYVVLGTLAGGAYFMWKPINWLVLFVFVYFAGLTAALLIFLQKNLLTTMKEDE